MGAAAGFRFLETNARLQVEHAVTEEVTGLDLVASRIRLAAGAAIDEVVPETVAIEGHALEARVYAEDPRRFLPSPGELRVFRPPADARIRVETGYAQGATVTPYYDPLLAKVIVRARSREGAITALDDALRAFAVAGVKTNIPFLHQALNDEDFRDGRVHTGLAGQVLAAKAAQSE